MINRKNFLKTSLLAIAPLNFSGLTKEKPRRGKKPVVISTWHTGIEANKAAWEVLSSGGYALDAVEKGVMVEEADPENTTVGYGGRPDRDGNVTLDACVMTETPHSLLVGVGAKKFALAQGFKEKNLLTKKSEKAWKEWLNKSEYELEINVENHDTIGMLALDEDGRVCGACTTSGAAYKMNGRVGDSPIIGSGLFIDPKVGGAVATGAGEEVVKTAGSHLVVEMMRAGHSPEKACKIAIERILERYPGDPKKIQVGYLALNNEGVYAGYSIQEGFDVSVYNADGNRAEPTEYLI